MSDWNKDLDSLFVNYKAALPDPEPAANFMPELWRKIEARQSFALRLKRLTRVFVGSAAAVCLLFAIIQAVPGSSHMDLHGTYVDALAASHPVDNLAAIGIVHSDMPLDPRTK